VRNLLLKLYVEAPPSRGFELLCQQAMPALSVIVCTSALALFHGDLLLADTGHLFTRVVALGFLLAVNGLFFYMYNWASLSVLADKSISAQFHAGLNALKRGATIVSLYYARHALRPPLSGTTIGGDDKAGHSDNTMLSLALVLLVGGRGLHLFPFPLNLGLLCPFPFNFGLLCPPQNPITPRMCPEGFQVEV
jgi:hypothetical protein